MTLAIAGMILASAFQFSVDLPFADSLESHHQSAEVSLHTQGTVNDFLMGVAEYSDNLIGDDGFALVFVTNTPTLLAASITKNRSFPETAPLLGYRRVSELRSRRWPGAVITFRLTGRFGLRLGYRDLLRTKLFVNESQDFIRIPGMQLLGSDPDSVYRLWLFDLERHRQTQSATVDLHLWYPGLYVQYEVIHRRHIQVELFTGLEHWMLTENFRGHIDQSRFTLFAPELFYPTRSVTDFLQAEGSGLIDQSSHTSKNRYPIGLRVSAGSQHLKATLESRYYPDRGIIGVMVPSVWGAFPYQRRLTHLGVNAGVAFSW